MKIKLMITTLAVIICAFVISGLHAVKEMNISCTNAYVQTKSATSDIGMCFDWYGLTLVDTTVKYANGMISSKEATHTLVTGAEENAALLDEYYKNILPDERKESEYIRSQDVVIQKLYNELLVLISKEDRKGVQAMLPSIYNVVDPLCAKINRIIEIKTEKALAEKRALSNNIDELQRFLFISFALCLSLCIGMAIKD